MCVIVWVCACVGLYMTMYVCLHYVIMLTGINCFVCAGIKGPMVEYIDYCVEWGLLVSTWVSVGHGIHYIFGNKIGLYVHKI